MTAQSTSLPAHHPTPELLLDYAAGCQPQAVALVVACHLALCPACRAEVARLEAVGGALLEEAEPCGMAPDALQRCLARLNEPAAPRPNPNAAGSPLLPQPLRGLVGDLAAARWRRAHPGVDVCDLPMTGGRTQLLRIAPRATVPMHTHEGLELALVLDGAYVDQTGTYGRGDVELADETLDHGPTAIPGRDCLCLRTQARAAAGENPARRWLGETS